MSLNRASRGLPVPTLGALVLVFAGVGAGWLVWSEWHESAAGSPAAAGQEEDQLAAALDHLHKVEAIAQNGAGGVPLLTADLANANPRMRRNALLALRQLGPDARDALASIHERLHDPDARTRFYAIEAYWHIGRDPQDVATVVSPLLGDQDADVRQEAARVLATIGPPSLGPILELLSGEMVAARVPGLQLLRRIGWERSQKRIEELVRKLAHDDGEGICREALLTLMLRGVPTTAEIRELLGEEPAAEPVRRGPPREPGPHEAALHTIIRLGPAGAENLPDLLSLLSAEHERSPAFDLLLAALRSMKNEALPAAPRLLQIFEKITDRRRFDVAWTLAAIGADPQDITRIVTPLLTHEDTYFRFHAGRLCAHVNPDEARRQVWALIPKLSPEEAPAGLAALDALWGLAPEGEEAIPALSRMLENPDNRVTRIAAKALGDIGPGAAPAVPAMLAALHRDPTTLDFWARSAIFEALGKVGPGAKAAMPDILTELNSPRFIESIDYSVHRLEFRPCLGAITAAALIGGADLEVLAVLHMLLAGEDDYVRRTALGWLVRLSPEAPDVLDYLLDRLDQSRGRAGVEDFLAIGNLNVDRREAVEPLTDALNNDDPEIRKAAAWALGKIGHDARAALTVLQGIQADWQNSFYDPDPPAIGLTVSSPYHQIEIWRWHDKNELVRPDPENRRLRGISVAQAAREAVAAIESAPAPLRKVNEISR
jgi:HEAT repeat protein